MTKFHGTIGYAENVETVPGVWRDVITEYPYYGDVVRNSVSTQEAQKVNDDISIGNSLSIVADDRLWNNFIAIKYVRWAGALWKVDDVTVQSPRLLLRLGGVYNGPTATAPINP